MSKKIAEKIVGSPTSPTLRESYSFHELADLTTTPNPMPSATPWSTQAEMGADTVAQVARKGSQKTFRNRALCPAQVVTGCSAQPRAKPKTGNFCPEWPLKKPQFSRPNRYREARQRGSAAARFYAHNGKFPRKICLKPAAKSPALRT